MRARAEKLAEQRRDIIRAREAKECMRREQEQADAWRRVETLVIAKRPADYGAAIALLKDLLFFR